MNGAVIWSCERRRGAIVWCEDGGELAIAKGGEAFAGPGFPEVGDLVALRVLEGAEAEQPHGSFRRAVALRVVERQHFADIRETLNQPPQSAAQSPRHARPAPRLKLMA